MVAEDSKYLDLDQIWSLDRVLDAEGNWDDSGSSEKKQFSESRWVNQCCSAQTREKNNSAIYNQLKQFKYEKRPT